MKRASVIILAVALFLLFKATNVYANIVFPAIANQFAVSFVVGFYWSVVMALLILFIEAFFIRKLLSLNYFIAFIFSFIINLISSFAGVIITAFTFGHGRNIFAYGNMKFGTYLGLIPGYVLTVLFEGLILALCVSLLKREKRASDCFKISALMNFYSYLILLVGIIAADIMTKGNNF
ncbi:MAG: hypothetical protein KJ710_03600 [Candidatus Omnitrophica bacterium]|nr:hypothetical protein [Candidatus Omnitrophota bacterium]MBU1923336.1 hypothetical protein [Candidatus Omnitrophota bacterium]